MQCATLIFFKVHAFGMQVVLTRWCRQDDIVVGVPYNGRDMPELQRLVGNFINMLPLRTRLPSNSASLASILQDVQQSLTAALTHAELPFGKMVEGLGVPRSATRTPVFQAIVAMNERMDKPSKHGLIVAPAEPTVCALQTGTLKRKIVWQCHVGKLHAGQTALFS